MKALPMMSFGEAVKTCFKKYATFSGRARRSEFWWFNVLNMILAGVSSCMFNWKMSVKSDIESRAMEAIFDQDKMDAILAEASAFDNKFAVIMIVVLVLFLLLLLPSLAVAARRLHDTGRSGWLILLGIIPIVNIVGAIVLFVFNVQDSKPEENKFGPSPKYVPEAVPEA